MWLEDKSRNPASVFGEQAVTATRLIGASVDDLSLPKFFRGAIQLTVGTWTAAFKSGPWSFLAIAVPSLIFAGIIGGAIARSAAETFVGRPTPRGVAAFTFAAKRARSFAIVLLAPWAVLGLLYLLNAILGWLGLSLPWVQVAGAVLGFVGVVGAALIFAVVGAYAVAAPMLPAALACEGTDAIDAVQRVAAYAWGRPGRLLLYGATLLVQGLFLAVVLVGIVGVVNLVAAESLTLWLPNDKGSYLRVWLISGEAPFTMSIQETASLKATGRVLGFWGKVPLLLVAGYLASFVFSGGSVWYLLMRLICDGQEPEELWSPSGPVLRPEGDQGANGEPADPTDE